MLDNPVDGIQFLWVHDVNTAKAPGFTRAEVDAINSRAFPDTGGIIFKETKTTTKPDDVVLTAGCYFMLLVQDNGRVTVSLHRSSTVVVG